MTKKYFVYTPNIPESPIEMPGPDNETDAEVQLAMDLSDQYPKVVDYTFFNEKLDKAVEDFVMRGFKTCEKGKSNG